MPTAHNGNSSLYDYTVTQNDTYLARRNFEVLFCSLAVLDPRVGHTVDALSPFISVLCHSD